MAEIEFFGVEEEILEVVNWLLGQQCALIPDIHYDSKTVRRMTRALEIRDAAISIPHFFVIREELLESPLDVREVTTTDKHFFYIDPRTGGPSLQFYWGRHTEKEGQQQFSTSWLSYYDWYINSVTGAREKLSKDLLEIYSNCAKLIRTRRRKIQPGKRGFFISPIMEQLIRSGAVLIGLEGLSADQILDSPTNAPSARGIG